MPATYMPYVVIGLTLGLLAGGFVYAVWEQRRRHDAWSGFAAERGWNFSESWGAMEVQGLYQGQQLSVATETRGRGKGRYTTTVVRLDLGDSVPPELHVEREGLGNKLLKLVGVRDEELGDAELDAALDLKGLSPESRQLLLADAVATALLEVRRHNERFCIISGLLEAEHRGTPNSPDKLAARVDPLLALADALHAESGRVRERRGA
ncbi:hypothetical protein LZ198_36855 [Myxococcus sp. K15C18031901]|uniref:hypothetical protein n=1 Tax=Myxococcus dinghuensis TaxID=2906761 RepID=UPI0020A80C37|nr:hypothetical protein [Myxococcus dinghuensis]MCP3104449.1 hypothetical protein [Myxococcus dinghuensis]